MSIKIYLDGSKERKTPFTNNVPDNRWYKAFLKRHPCLTERQPEGVSNASACVSESDIRKWFCQISTYLKQENYWDILSDPTRIFNSDETCFMVCPKLKQVIAPRGTRNVYEIDKGNAKLNLTVLFTFGASGIVTPPMVVYPYQRLPAAVGQSVPNTWGIGVTPCGWMTAELFIEYIKNVLYPYLVNKKVIFPIILFVDGHASHVTLQVSELCSKLQIVLICLYPNATRILQPADVAAFKPIKTLWKKSLIDWRRSNPTATITMDKMAPILEKTIHNLLSLDNIIKNGFRTCGIYPWNSNSIDYSKCIGAEKETPSVDAAVHLSSKATLSFEAFQKTVGTDLMSELQATKSKLEKCREFRILHSLLQQFTVTNRGNSPPAEELLLPVENLYNAAEELLPPVENLNNTADELLLPVENLNNTADELLLPVENLKNTTEELLLPVETVDNTIKVIAEPIVNNHNTSNNPNNFNYDDKENYTSEIMNFLEFPQAPKRKGKKETKKITYAITSSEWKINQMTKIEQRKLKEMEKEAKKCERQQKKEEKGKEQEAKKVARLKKKRSSCTTKNIGTNEKEESRNEWK